MHNLKIDAERLWGTIMETGQIGGTEKGGVRRLTLTDLDRQVRDWFWNACEDAGCSVTIDEMGNMFARRPGRDNSLPPIMVGSHLDTQPSGGKFDGVLGVLSGLELVRTLNAAGYETTAPIEVANWTNEEGSRFSPAMVASGVFAGVFDRDYAYGLQDREGLTFGAELRRIGFQGEAKCGGRPLSAYFELHIEQGPILEAEDKRIGVVTHAQGTRWYNVKVTGFESHAGTTPMPMRRDALVGAALLIAELDAIALRHAPAAMSTVGVIDAQPGSINVIAGEVSLTVDLRHPEDAVLDAMDAAFRSAAERIGKERRLDIAIENFWKNPPTAFDGACVDIVRQAAEAAGYAHRDIISGAGHDAVYIARIAPTAMIFVPCEKGISHNETENIGIADAEAGANVLMRAVLEYDRRLAERESRS
jgi:beta-ureidopropionase / N-carbamoyl-L-amino-acid hydrolase